MPHPDNFSTAAYDAAQGRDDDGSDDFAREMEWIEAALVQLHAAAEKLRTTEPSNRRLRDACWEAGDTVEALAYRIKGMMP